MSYQLLWLRTDLRVTDHPALTAALNAGPTVAVYFITPQQWQSHGDAACKLEFWRRNLQAVATALQHLNVPLLIRYCPNWQTIPEALATLCQHYRIRAVHLHEEYPLNEQRRDAAVQEQLAQQNIRLHRYQDQVFFAPGTVLTRNGQYFQIYTPFRTQCHARLLQQLPHCLPIPKAQPPLPLRGDRVPETFPNTAAPPESFFSHWPAGEAAAQQRLNLFVDQHLTNYPQERDFPAQQGGTSQLSPYLTAGVLSPRQCLQAALSQTGGRLAWDHPGFTTWVGELLWREFYRHLMQGYPRLSMGQAFKPETEAIQWRQAPKDLAAWQQGQTGMPIVDAAMRCLKATGWMHNRLRMIVAMFLTKHLLMDWRSGERWFMQQLIDGDFAQNNGGWQWSASTGTDAVPYFRIFNPITQSKKFDPEGHFIRQWLPELAHVHAKHLHDPATLGGLFGLGHYPRLILDLKQSRTRALEAFQNLKQSP